jgi:anti-sigma regulatory factor (Ser/Thr protein kinase)
MVDDRLRLQVFVASPSDTHAERRAMRGIVEELNLGVADSRGIVLELVEWETHSWPGVGLDAQDVINHQIDVPDIVIGIFWKRLGTETGRAASGTVEEIENALSLRAAGHSIEVLVYFNEQNFFPRADDLEQVARVLQFRGQLQGRGLLTSSYEGLEDFKTKVRVHLTQIVRRWPVDRRHLAVTSKGTRAAGGKTASGGSSWRSLATEGRLSVRISSLLGGEAYALTGAVAEAMQEKGFRALARERVTVTIMELLANVASHAEGPAEVNIAIHSDYFRYVEVSVTSKGRLFDVRQAVDDDITRLDAGDREHGLLRVARFTGSLSSAHDPGSGTTKVICEVYDPVRPASAMEGIPRLAQVVHVHSHPQCLWVGGEYYAGTACELLDKESRRLWELFFGPLSDVNPAWLGIEHMGASTRVHDDDVIGRMTRTTREDEIEFITDRAVEAYFRPAFDARQVLVLAHNTGPGIARGVEWWARQRGLRVFFSEDDFKRRIAELGLG